MNSRYLRVSILSAAGLTAGMLLIFAHLAMSAPALMAAEAGATGGTIPLQAVLTPTKDNTIYDTSPPSSNGAGEYLFVGNTDSDSSRRALLAFDIAGSIPPSSTILSVTLQMNMSKLPSANATTVKLHPVAVDWGEGTSNALGEEGSGATPSTGDATWQHTFFNTQLWQNPGGDFNVTPSAAITLTGLGLYRWGPTTGLVNDVQSWLDTPSTNFGWILIGNEAAARTARRFDASENNNAADRPQLTIVFTTPGQAIQPLYLPLIRKP